MYSLILLEKTAGNLPVWLAPEQIRVITVNQENDTVTFADKVLDQARELGLRIEVDNTNESVGKKIRASELMKIPYTIVLGEKEMGGGKIMPRIRKDLVVSEEPTAYELDVFLKTVAHEAKGRVTRTTL